MKNSKKTISRDSYFWNTCAGLLNAGQSVILLIIITHSMDIESAGIFTIAFATANLLLILGNYGMRAYQVTDIQNRYSFQEYRASRTITSFLMLVVSFAYVNYMEYIGNYSQDKGNIVFAMCLLKLIDAVEDVYHGMYQQRGRLDIGARLLTGRGILTIFIFSISIVRTKNLLTALIITITVSAIFCAISLFATFSLFEVTKLAIRRKYVWELLFTCFPIFAGSFLLFYIGNAPKYAIDTQLNDTLQACYGFIAMPVFVVGLLNNFVYQPILTKLAVMWERRKIKQLAAAVLRQCKVVIILTLLTMFGGYVIGIPVLSFLYNMDLSLYREELVILLAAGGLLALSGFLNIAITIVRFQKSILWGYLVVALLAYFFSPLIVAKYQLLGASWLYFTLMFFLVVIFGIIFWWKIKRENA